ncbi:MAG: cob(I)yrinic acid a,c-diamide adenosyltransferase [Pseudomonadota bacterium]|nr:cob(I)yrinic acid a,c-diamide adenosyltransferase [Pseudomonadota bacterium]
MDEQEKNRRHKEKMVKRKAFQDKLVREADKTKPLLMVYTGTGKGKSTAAFGTVLRSLGHGYKVGIVQFIKGGWSTGEQKALERFDDLVTYIVAGEGFTWETQDRARDMQAARAAWDKALALLADDSYHLVVLDELNIVLRYDYLPVEEIVAVLKKRTQHVIVTGRNAPPALADAADLVTEMTLVKHPFREQGIKAQKGIEY